MFLIDYHLKDIILCLLGLQVINWKRGREGGGENKEVLVIFILLSKAKVTISRREIVACQEKKVKIAFFLMDKISRASLVI